MPLEFSFAYVAFCALSGDREAGFGVGPIRFTAIDAYARRYRIDGLDEFDEFSGHIRLIDGIYLNLTREKDS